VGCILVCKLMLMEWRVPADAGTRMEVMQPLGRPASGESPAREPAVECPGTGHETERR